MYIILNLDVSISFEIENPIPKGLDKSAKQRDSWKVTNAGHTFN